MKKQIYKIGDLIKDRWGASSKVDDWKKKLYNLTNDLFIPPMGIIKDIKKVTKFKTQIIENKKERIPYQIEVAVIEWTTVKIPEINAETNKWELDHYIEFRKELELKHITSYQNYYKNLLKRKLKKNP